MGDNKNPSQNQNIDQNPNQNPGKRFPSEHPGERPEPRKERASNPNQDRDDAAAKRQQRQDPLQQNKDRDR